MMQRRGEGGSAVSDALPEPIRTLVFATNGLVRAELREAFDEDFDVEAVSDVAAAERAAEREPHALVVVADDLHASLAHEVISRVRVTSPGRFRVGVLVLAHRLDASDLPIAYHAGADDVARWPIDEDMFRARVRSVVRVACLEASMARCADSGSASAADVRCALGQSVHLINNAVAGISGRAQLAALTGVVDDAGLVPVCLSEARKMTIVLAALHRLAEAAANDPVEDPVPA